MAWKLLLCFLCLAWAQSPSQRAKDLLSRMSLDDKLNMVRGYPQDGQYVGNVIANEALGIPSINMEDGPQGVADGVKLETCWPSALTVVASWDEDLMYEFGAAMGLEQKMKGTNVMLGPMINLARVPVGGRNFESCGEDPYLCSKYANSSVLGIQSNGILACAKHFVNNNQELNRTLTSAWVSKRAAMELYYPAFQTAVDAGVGSIMCSYNKINGTYACENPETLRILKEVMGFQGYVMSDWGATHSTVNAANAGLDMQMPDDSFFGKALADAVANGNVTEDRINDMVYRIVLPMFELGIFDRPQTGNLSVDAQSPEHVKLTRRLARESTVLLNNSGILPLDETKINTLMIIGDDASVNPIVAGGGSGHVIAPYIVTGLDAIKKRLGSNVNVIYCNSSNIQCVTKNQADYMIAFFGVTTAEGSDRPDLNLYDSELIDALQAFPELIVILNNPGAIIYPFQNSNGAVLACFYPGEEAGNALVEILFGDYSPSGKLPITLPKADQNPLETEMQYPGIGNDAYYTEDLLVGYRWFQYNLLQPEFPFGHGLSYSDFAYSDVSLTGNPKDGISITIVLTNVGYYPNAASEVAQLYMSYPSGYGEPPLVLRGFKKVTLTPGESLRVTFDPLYEQDLALWDTIADDWTIIQSTYYFLVGTSSEDLSLYASYTVE